MPKPYIDNKLFSKACDEYATQYRTAKQAGEPLPPLTDYIGKCLLLMVDRIGKKANFSRYSFIEEMQADGLMACVKYLHNFKAEKCVVGGAFSYATQIISQAMIRRINIEQTFSYKRSLLATTTKTIDSYHRQDHDCRVYSHATLKRNSTDFEGHQRIIEATEARLSKRSEQTRTKPASTVGPVSEITYNGITATPEEWASRLRLTVKTVRLRHGRGAPLEARKRRSK